MTKLSFKTASFLFGVILLWALVIPLVGRSQEQTIFVKGTQIYTACGEPLVLRGVNEMFIWSGDQTGKSILPEIAKTGANAVRLVWTTEGSAEALDSLINNCLNAQMIPIPELHDATGNFTKLPQCLQYWARPQIVKIIKKYERWIIVNIANEVGGGMESDSKYLDEYKKAITALRNAGLSVPLMIDAGGWGNNEKYVVNNGKALMAHDSLHNLLFSVHTYWGGDNQEKRLDSLISAMSRLNLPLIFAEGPQKAKTPQNCNADFPYEYMINRCQQERIGWLSWSWGAVNNGDCGSPNSVFDMTTDGKFGHWATRFAEDICVSSPFSIRKTSEKPYSMVFGKCKTKD